MPARHVEDHLTGPVESAGGVPLHLAQPPTVRSPGLPDEGRLAGVHADAIDPAVHPQRDRARRNRGRQAEQERVPRPRPLSEGVPGAFTLAGMRRYFGLRDAALARARSETWVLGPAGTLQMRALPEELDRLYFTRYSAAWDAIIGDVGLRPLSSAGDGAAMVQLLTGRDSPLRAYLMRAAKETTLASAASPPVQV